MPPRKGILRRPAAPVAHLTAEEGRLLQAHVEGLAAAWNGIREMGSLGPDVMPCCHVRAAIRLLLFERVDGVTDIDRTLFERAGVPLPDLRVEAGPLANDPNPSDIVAHMAAGCTEKGTTPMIHALAPADPPEMPPSREATHTVPGYAWEAGLVEEHVRAVKEGVLAAANGEYPCEHLVCSVRRTFVARRVPGALQEAAMLKRVGATLPDYSDPAVERWMDIPHDDGTLKAHLQACPLRHDPSRWPNVRVAIDGGARPVRVVTPNGSRLQWPDPVWS